MSMPIPKLLMCICAVVQYANSQSDTLGTLESFSSGGADFTEKIGNIFPAANKLALAFSGLSILCGFGSESSEGILNTYIILGSLGRYIRTIST